MAASHAGVYLRSLLEGSEHHRRRWVAHVTRDHGCLSTAAVCRVLAQHLWDTGERPESLTDLPRRLRDLVGRALSGEVLTNETARWFAESFELRAHERAQLLVELARPLGARPAPAAVPAPATVRGLYAHVHHTVGVEGGVVRSDHVRVLEVGAARGVAAVGHVADGWRLELGADLQVAPTAAPGGRVLLHRPIDQDEPRQVVRWATEAADGRWRGTVDGPCHVDELLGLPWETVVVTITFQADVPPWVEIGVRDPADRSTSEVLIALPDDHGVVTRVLTGCHASTIDYGWLDPATVTGRAARPLQAAG